MSSIVLGTLYEAGHPELSPIDELQHIDYAAEASHGHIIRRGELVGETAMRAESCRGIAVPDYKPPPCTSPVLDPKSYQNGGQSTGYLDPPLYYLVTGVAARFLMAVSPGGDFVTWSRRIGTGWLALGLIALWAAFGELGIGLSRRALALLLVVSSPVVLFTQASVTSDAILLTTGACELLAVLRWEARRCPSWVVVVIAALGTMGKLNAAVAALASAVYLLLRNIDDSGHRTRSEYVRLAALVVGVTTGVALLWVFVVEQRALVPADAILVNAHFKVKSLNLGDLVSAASATLSPVQNPPLGWAFEPRTTLGLVSIHHVLLVVPTVTYVFLGTKSGALRSLAISTAGLAILLGPLIAIWTYVTQGLYFPTPPRYGLTLLAPMVVLLGAILDTSLGRVILGAIAGSSYLYFLSRLL